MSRASPAEARKQRPPIIQYGVNPQGLGAPTCSYMVLTSPQSESKRLFIQMHGDWVVGAIGMSNRHDMGILASCGRSVPCCPSQNFFKKFPNCLDPETRIEHR